MHDQSASFIQITEVCQSYSSVCVIGILPFCSSVGLCSNLSSEITSLPDNTWGPVGCLFPHWSRCFEFP